MKPFLPFINRLYPESSDLKYQVKRYERLAADFSQRFSGQATHYFSVPGRIELGGNHTDHNNGRVLAASINLDVIAAVSSSGTETVTVYSESFEKPFILDLRDLSIQKGEEGTTEAIIRGIAARFESKGYEIGGFYAYMSSDVPLGSGLSSSAAVEILFGNIFNQLFNEGIVSQVEIAKAGQYAENKYFGKPCGLMDQLACAMGGIVSIDFADPENPVIERIETDFTEKEIDLLVVNTGENHADLTENYAAIPSEMKAIASHFGKEALRDLDEAALQEEIPGLRAIYGDRAVLRALHFMRENERVSEQVAALKTNDIQLFTRLVDASGNSSFKYLQNIFSTKHTSSQSLSLALALTENFIAILGRGACRVHGGGFAGTILVLIPKSSTAEYINTIEKVFGKGSALILSIRRKGIESILI